MPEPAAFPPDCRHAGKTDLQKAQIVMLRMLRVVDAICRAHHITYWIDAGTLLGAVRHDGFIPWDDDIDLAMPRADYNRFLEIAPSLMPDDMYVQTRELDARYQSFAMPCKIRDRHSMIHEATQPTGGNSGMGLFMDIIPVDKFHASGLAFRIDYARKWIYRRLCVLPTATLVARGGLRGQVNNMIVRLRPILGTKHWLVWYRNRLHARVCRRNMGPDRKSIIGYGFDSYWIAFFATEQIFPLRDMVFEGYSFPAPANADAVLKVFYGDYMQLPPEPEQIPAHLVNFDVSTEANGGSGITALPRSSSPALRGEDG